MPLIYGRRDQAQKRPEWTKRSYADLDGEDQIVMTYDRLIPSYDFRDSLREVRQGQEDGGLGALQARCRILDATGTGTSQPSDAHEM